MKYNSTFKNPSAFETWLNDNGNSITEATEIVANHGKCFHFYEDGSYEECPNIEEHNKNNWQDYEND